MGDYTRPRLGFPQFVRQAVQCPLGQVEDEEIWFGDVRVLKIFATNLDQVFQVMFNNVCPRFFHNSGLDIDSHTARAVDFCRLDQDTAITTTQVQDQIGLGDFTKFEFGPNEFRWCWNVGITGESHGLGEAFISGLEKSFEMRFDDVQEFLRGQGSSGQRDSTGEFTISSERAFEKLALHSLDHPEEWILKAVQAAVRGGSSRLMFRCTRRALVVDFFDLEEECLEDWRVALLKPGWCESAFFKEFEIGLRSVLLRHRFRTTSRDGRVLDWDGRELRVHQGSPLRESSCLQLEVAHDQLGGDSKRLWPVSRARKALAYQSLLQSRALYAPLELVFDGRPITALEATLNDTEGPRLWGRPTSSALLYCELGKNFDGHTLARCLELTASKLLSDALHARNHFLFTPSPSKEIFYHFHLFAKYTTEPGGEHEEAYRAMKRAQFRFEFTRLGVVCATRAGSRVLGGAFHIPYDEGRSDVSGLSLFIPKERTSEMDALLCRTAPLLVRLEKELERHESRAHWEAGALRRGAVGLASGGPVVGVGGLLAGAKVALALKLGALGGALAGVPILLSCQKDTKDQIADIREAVKMFRDFSGKVGH